MRVSGSTAALIIATSVIFETGIVIPVPIAIYWLSLTLSL